MATTRVSKRVRIKDGVLGAEGQMGTDEGLSFSERYHHIKLDGRDRTSAFKPSEFTRVSS